jgi:RHS repeat-associated protein
MTQQTIEIPGTGETPVTIKDVTVSYDENRFRPKQVVEVFDGKTKKTVNTYQWDDEQDPQERGNIIKQKVYDGDGGGQELVAYSEMEYHPDYDFVTKQVTYQSLGSDPDPTQGATGKVETSYNYGDKAGTADPDNHGAYLVREEVFVDENAQEADKYAKTYYTYETAGQVHQKADPEDNWIECTYDDNGYMTEEAVYFAPLSQWTTIKKFYYDAIGQLILEGNHRGGVKHSRYDAFGRVWKVDTFEDSELMMHSFVPTRYYDESTDTYLFTPTSEVYYGYDERGNRVYEEKIVESYDIEAVDTTNMEFTIDGKRAWQFPAGNTFRVARTSNASGNTNDGIYTIYAVEETQGGQTVITTKESVDHQTQDAGVVQLHGITTTDYTTGNQVRQIAYEDGSNVRRFYDGRGLKVEELRYDSKADADKKWWSILYTYDDMDRLTSTDWYDYADEPDRITSVVKSEGSEYYASGQKKYEYLYNGDDLENPEQTGYYEYNILDKVTKSVVDPGTGKLELTTDYHYDDVGNLDYKVLPEGNLEGEEGNYIFYDYDNANRQIREYFVEAYDDVSIQTTYQNADKKKETSYYKNSHVKSVKQYDSDGSTVLARTDLVYDEIGRVIQVDQAIEQVGGDVTDWAQTYYDYKDNGSYFPDAPAECQVRITHAADNLTYMKHGPFGQITRIWHPTGRYEVFEYNHGVNTMKSKSILDGVIDRQITYDYDGHSRLKRVYYPPDNESYYVEYSYDGFGRKTGVLDKRSDSDRMAGTYQNPPEITYNYDVLDRVSAVTEHDDYQISYTYRSDGQKESVKVYDDSNPPVVIYEVEYAYDGAMRLATVKEPGFGNDDLIASFQYDDNGNRTQLKYYRQGNETGSTTKIDYTYGGCSCGCGNFLKSFSTTGGPTFSFDATGASDIDGLGRLKNASETLTKVGQGAGTVSHDLSYTYDMLSRLETATSTNVYEQPNADLTFEHIFDDFGNITQLEYNKGSGEVTRTYDYDRDVLLSYTEGATTKSVAWDKNGRQFSQPSDSAQWQDYELAYTWDGRLRYGEDGGDTKKMEAWYTPDGARIAKKRQVLAQHDESDQQNRPIYFYLHDRLGSVRQVIDDAADVVHCYTYDPWGLTVGAESQETVGKRNLYRFAGYVWDPEVTQYYCNARQYDPVLARFTSRDPLQGSFKEPMTLHKYLYCADDPINRTDPTGKQYSGALERGYQLAYSASAYYVMLNTMLLNTDDPADMLNWLPRVNAYREFLFDPEEYHRRPLIWQHAYRHVLRWAARQINRAKRAVAPHMVAAISLTLAALDVPCNDYEGFGWCVTSTILENFEISQGLDLWNTLTWAVCGACGIDLFLPDPLFALDEVIICGMCLQMKGSLLITENASLLMNVGTGRSAVECYQNFCLSGSPRNY